MTDILSKIDNYIFNKSIKPLHKFVVFGLIVLIVVFIESITGFTEHYDTKNKLSEIQTINEILNNNTLSQSDINELKRKRTEILNDWNVIDYMKNQSSKIFFNKRLIENNETSIITSAPRNIYLDIITASWFCMLLIVYIPIELISSKRKITIRSVFKLTTLLVILIILGFVLSYILALIPTILNTPILNYLLNISISLIIIYNTVSDDMIIKSVQKE